jgi:acid phosphatase
MAPAMAADDSNSKMVFAIDVIRHGDRAPVADFPAAPHKWPQGLGQLTPEGMRGEFELGKMFRAKYIDKNHLLPPTYDCDSMYVRASDIDRTLMSAECTLLGLYPLGQGPVMEDGKEGVPQRYQPIPIHTRPRETDDVLIADVNKSSPDIYRHFVYESPEWKAKQAEVEPNFERWSKLTGFHIKNLQTMTLVGDTAHIRRIHHVPLPPGMTQADEDAMADVGEWVFGAKFKPPEVGQATGLNLLRLIEKYLSDATKGDGKLKYVLFSAHDSTICSLLSAIKAPTNSRPRYSSDVNISLWKSGDKYTVKVSFNEDPVNVPGSSNGEISYEKFSELAQPVAAVPTTE